VREKNDIIANNIGEIPLQREKLPNDKNASITTPVDDKNHTIRATSNIIPIPIRSTFGGPRSSSVAIERSANALLFSDIVI
jgi:hypothetical protein